MAELTENRIILGGLDCADCAAKLEKRVFNLEGVEEAQLNFNTSKLTVKHQGVLDHILKLIQEAGYKAQLESGAKGGLAEPLPLWKETKTILTIISGALLALGFLVSFIPAYKTWSIGLFLLAMLSGGFYVARSGIKALFDFSLDMNFLMTVASVGAAALGEWSEGAMVVFLFSLGNTLQAYTMDKTRQSIRALMDLSPKEALVRRGHEEITLPVEEVRVGDVLVVKPGEKIPMDGFIIEGSSAVNQASITGESMPVDKKFGEQVFAGSINGEGGLAVKVTKLAGDNTLARILHLVEEAQGQKAPSQHFVDKFSRYYTPIVTFGAVGVAILPWLIFNQPFTPWFYRALILLVISCPCALVISTPVAIVSAIGNASRNGILVKGGTYLEGAGALQVIAFDKTGTLTLGQPEVTDVVPAGSLSDEEVLALVMGIEKNSEHPLAKAIMRKGSYEKIRPLEVQDFRAITGKGAQAVVNGTLHYVGNIRLFKELGVDFAPFRGQLQGLIKAGKTIMLLGTGTELLALIAVADKLRDNACEAVKGLKKSGISRVAMLTGDHRGTAEAIAGELGLDQYHAELMPEDKLIIVRDLVQKYGNVAMVGDGINDAPALAEASVGIAMGAAGTDVALETADVALMSDDLTKLEYFITLSRRTLRIIKENISFSIAVKFIFVILTFMNLSNLWMAVFADTGTALIVILNGMRLLPGRK